MSKLAQTITEEDDDMIQNASAADYIDDVYENDPVQHLFLSILESALYDLKSVDALTKHNAMCWFTSFKSWLPHGISYVDVLENCTLSATQLRAIDKAIKVARH